MKILLIGEYYSGNLGDPLLCETVAHLIRQKYPDAEIISFDMSGKVSAESWFKTSNRFRELLDRLMLYSQVYIDRRLYRLFRDEPMRYVRMWCNLCMLLRKHRFDTAVFAGGSMFMDYFILSIYLITKKLNSAGVNTVFHACGMGELSKEPQILLNRALHFPNVVSVSLRDSFEHFASEFKLRANVLETYDTALNCCRFFPKARRITAEYGIGLMKCDLYFDEQVRLIRIFMNSDENWCVFCNGAEYDLKAARQILLKAGVAESDIDRYLLPGPTTAAELINTVTQFQKIVSFRMHSQIAAASFGIPCYGFAWSPKVRDFYSKLGYPDNCAEHVGELASIQKELDICAGTIQAHAEVQARISQEHLYLAIEDATGKGSGYTCEHS